ncbi:hypothetical protein JZ751_001546, partial [Albula glossodonta]
MEKFCRVLSLSIFVILIKVNDQAVLPSEHPGAGHSLALLAPGCGGRDSRTLGPDWKQN